MIALKSLYLFAQKESLYLDRVGYIVNISTQIGKNENVSCNVYLCFPFNNTAHCCPKLILYCFESNHVSIFNSVMQ